MFKYNELSDLKDGSLVKPLSKMEDGSIRCINENGEESFHSFNEFDFKKKVEDRKPIEIPQPKPKPEPEPESEPEPQPEPEGDLTYQDLLDKMQDDSLNDGSDDLPPDPEPDPDPEPIIKEEEGFCDELETEKVINNAGLPKGNYLVWKDII